MLSIRTEWSQWVRDECERRGVSIRALLRKAGKPTSALYRWERGHVPSEASKAAIRDALAATPTHD